MSNGEENIGSHVSLSQCRKAVEALHSHELKKQNNFEEIQILPAKEQHIWLNVTVKKISPTNKLKPHKMYVVEGPS
jgi:ribosome biogenesis protein UTP30